MTLTHLVGAVGVLALQSAAVHAQGSERDSVVYVLSPTSRFEVKTGKGGLFGFAGHDHVIRARTVSGRVVYYPSLPESSRVEITVPTDSLEVLTPPDTAEIRKVTQSMRTEVLHVDQYAVINFVSTTVAPISDRFRVQGRLTIVGVTREVAADFGVQVGTDTLRATGNFSVKQTDFGIRPYRGGPAGTVRVADRVTFEIEAIAIRAPDP
ncbi:MAG TPA: YceI family protein [Gemmatimonadales bacterium]|nr:YceI family protein [Gemmatimonadales bacterium]